MPKPQPSGPQNVTVLGDGIFKEVISYNEVIWVGPEPLGQVPLQEKEIRTQTRTGMST